MTAFQHAQRPGPDRYCPYCAVGGGNPCVEIDTPLDRAIEKSRETPAQEWHEQAQECLIAFHRLIDRDVTADAFDVWSARRGLTPPPDGGWQALWDWAAHEKRLIAWTGEVRASVRPERNGAEVKVFRSTHDDPCAIAACRGESEEEVAAARTTRLMEQAQEFDVQNPRVYELLAHDAKIAKAAKAKRLWESGFFELPEGKPLRLGIRTLWERLRWLALLDTIDGFSEWKLNDHYHSYYSRALMDRERCSPECAGCLGPNCLAGFFELRELRSS